MRRRSILAATAASLAAAACGPFRGDDEPDIERTISEANVNPWGANAFLHKEVEFWKKEKTFEMARNAGIVWIKQHFPWELIEQSQKGNFYDQVWQVSAWQRFDEIVDLAEEFDLKLIVRVDRSPLWAQKPDAQPEWPPAKFEDYGDFMAVLAERYKGRISHYQLWNEPNLAREWGSAPDPKGYVDLLRVGYERLKEVDPDIKVLTAPLAITLERSPRAMVELDYLDQMYQHGAFDYFDIMSANAYGLEYPPTAEPDPDVLNFRRVELLREVMERNGDTNKAIWFNEYGWNASPADMPADKLIWRRVKEEEQAEWTVEGVKYGRSNWPWAGVFCIWYLRQVGDIPPSSSEYYFRMIDPEFTPRLVYNEVKRNSKKIK